MKKKKLLFMNIKDKVDVGEGFCPPHHLPHKPPIGEKISEEPCHFHTSKLRMAHHTPFCKLLKCHNYKRMIEKYKEYKKL